MIKKTSAKQHSLKRVTTIFMVCLFIIPLFAQAIIAAYSVNMVIKGRILTGATQNMENATLYVSDILQTYYDTMIDVSRRDTIKRLMAEVNDGNMSDTHYKLRNEIYSEDSRTRYRYPYDYELLLYNGIMFTTYTHSPYGNYTELYKQISNTDWFKKMKNSYSRATMIFTSPDLLNKNNNDKLYIVGNMIDDINMGILCIGIDQSFLAGAIEKTKVSEDGNVFLFDKYNNLLICGASNTMEFEDLKDNAGELKAYIVEEKVSRVRLSQGGTTKMYLVMKQDFTIRGYDTDMKILSITPEDSIMGEANNIIYTNLVLIVFYLLSVGLATYLLGRVVVNPIVQMSKLVREISAGNLDIRVRGLPQNEIGQLGDGFNSMLEKLAANIDEIKMAESEKRKNEIKLLQAQIKPHFVRNMINCVIWLANLKGASGISRSLNALSNLLEYNFKDAKLLSTVRDELDYVREYFYLQKVRYQHKISDQYDVDEELLSCEILKLTFQPIVENAIVHGLLNRNGTGVVHISGRIEDQKMIFEISDNGVGMEENVVYHLLEPSQQKYDDTNHIALWNINKRIKSQYGEQYGLKINSIIGEGTNVNLCMPMPMDGEEKKHENFNC